MICVIASCVAARTNFAKSFDSVKKSTYGHRSILHSNNIVVTKGILHKTLQQILRY